MPLKYIKRIFSPRILITVLAVAVGTFSVVLISAAGYAGKVKLTFALDSMGMKSVIIRAENVAGVLSEEDLKITADSKGVSSATPLMSDTARVRLRGDSYATDCLVWGILPEAKNIISLEACQGRLIENSDINELSEVCVIDENIAKRAYGRTNIVGKKVTLSLGGIRRTFTVVGVAKSGMSPLQSTFGGMIPDFIYIPLAAHQRFTGRNNYDAIAAMSDNEKTNIADTITTAFSRTGIQSKSEFSIANLSGQKASLEKLLDAASWFLTCIAAVSLVVAGFSLLAAMLSAVTERRREIGIKKSIGASNFDICKEFLSESAIISISGGTLGTLTALFSYFIASYFLALPVLPLSILILPNLFVIILAVIFGVYPALKAANMQPCEALKQE